MKVSRKDIKGVQNRFALIRSWNRNRNRNKSKSKNKNRSRIGPAAARADR